MIVKDDANHTPDPMSQWEKEVGAIYDLVSVSPRAAFQEGGFLPVRAEVALCVQEEADLSVTGCFHIMDTDSIRHIVRSHGSQRETLRGQVALVRADFLLLPDILADPETVENGGKTKPGRDTIRYIKTIAGFRYFYIEELRTKKNRLAAVTFYKRRG